MAKFISSGFAVGLMIVLMMICCRIPGVPATSYTVGDSSGWAMGGDYSTWASDKTFAVGDTLVFNYASGHTVDEVSENDYKSCTTGNSITSDSSGATSVTLKTAGSHYFMCGVPGHCSGGMKITVTTAAAAGAAGGAPSLPGAATSPPSATTSPAKPTGVATPRAGTLTQPSSSAALSPAVAASFAVFAVVFKGLVF